jgi:hypothetical protein
MEKWYLVSGRKYQELKTAEKSGLETRLFKSE